MYGILIFVTALVVIIVTSLLKSVHFSKQTKSLIAMSVSVVAGGVAAVIQNDGFDGFTDSGIVGTVLIVYGLATAIYQLIIPDSVDSVFENMLVKPKASTKHIPGEFSDTN